MVWSASGHTNRAYLRGLKLLQAAEAAFVCVAAPLRVPDARLAKEIALAEAEQERQRAEEAIAQLEQQQQRYQSLLEQLRQRGINLLQILDCRWNYKICNLTSKI